MERRILIKKKLTELCFERAFHFGLKIRLIEPNFFCLLGFCLSKSTTPSFFMAKKFFKMEEIQFFFNPIEFKFCQVFFAMIS